MAAAFLWVYLWERTSFVLDELTLREHVPSWAGQEAGPGGSAEGDGVLLLFEEHVVHMCVGGRPAFLCPVP